MTSLNAVAAQIVALTGTHPSAVTVNATDDTVTLHRHHAESLLRRATRPAPDPMFLAGVSAEGDLARQARDLAADKTADPEWIARRYSELRDGIDAAVAIQRAARPNTPGIDMSHTTRRDLAALQARVPEGAAV